MTGSTGYGKGTDSRMSAPLPDLFGRERAGLRQNVFGDGELPDVVQQSGGLDRVHVGGRESEPLGQADRARLHALDVLLAGLILGVDGARERLNGREMQIRSLLNAQAPRVDLALP